MNPSIEASTSELPFRSRQAGVNPNGITVLAEPATCNLDIVFVHGFTGHPRKSWTYTGQPHSNEERPSKIRRLLRHGGSQKESQVQIFWPQDLLPDIMPHARIITYGYDSRIQHPLRGSSSQNTVLEIGQNLLVALEPLRRSLRTRPLIFVAHSLGGIMVKETLSRSKDHAEYQRQYYDIYESTRGLIFFGTPHSGADHLGAIRPMLESLARICGFAINDQLMRSILPNAAELKRLREEFSIMTRTKSWTIYSFQEEYPSRLLGRKVVEDSSSALDDPTVEIKQSIAGDHIDMCCFSGSENPEFRKVADALAYFNYQADGRASPLQSLFSATSTAETPDDTIKEGITEVSENASTAFDDAYDSDAYNACLASLDFQELDSRFQSIELAMRDTCRWIFDDPNFKSWLNEDEFAEHLGFLWMRGKPGAGKSTLMKHVYSWLLRNRPEATAVSYFFHARGDILEKTTLGMYRSLVHQILKGLPGLFGHFRSTFLRRQKYSNGCLEWKIEDFQGFLSSIVKDPHCPRLILLIDALDETKEDDIRLMIKYLETLSEDAFDKKIQLNILFSSRHYPCITISQGRFLDLDKSPGHTDDMAKYINKELFIRKRNSVLEDIKAEILDRASGVFLWIVLVVKSLRRDYDRGDRNLSALQRRLREIPDRLQDLFVDMLRRDTEDMENLVSILQWILFARRPLTPAELNHIMSFQANQQLELWEPELWDAEAFKNFVISRSKGLAQLSRGRSPTVQFIHESVRQFLLDEGLALLSEDLSSSPFGRSHEQLAQRCFVYLMAIELKEYHAQYQNKSGSKNDRFRWISLSHAKSTEAKDLRQRVCDDFPFAHYATDMVLFHANQAEFFGMEQRALLKNLGEAKAWMQWVRVNNIFEKHEIRRYDFQTSRSYVLSEKGHLSLLSRMLLEDPEQINQSGTRHRNVLDAGLANGHLGVLDVCLEVEDWRDLQSTELSTALQAMSPTIDLEVVRLLTEKAFKLRLSSSWQEIQNILSQGLAQSEIVLRLMGTKGLDLNCTMDKETPLIYASKQGNIVDVETLLFAGASIWICDSRSWTAFNYAVKYGYGKIITRLLDATTSDRLLDAAISDRLLNAAIGDRLMDFPYFSALYSAILEGSEDLVKRLLSLKACLKIRDRFGATLLHRAATCNDPKAPMLLYSAESMTDIDHKVVKLLIRAGADLAARDEDGRTPLHRAVTHNDHKVAKVMLDAGADLTARNRVGQTPLYYAIVHRNGKIVKLLLDAGADFREIYDDGSTPLHQAIFSLDMEIVELLLDAGADLTAKDQYGNTTPHHSTSYDCAKIIESLLDSGTDHMAKNQHNKTLWDRVLACKNESVLELLLGSGAEFNSTKAWSFLLYQKAVGQGHDKFVKLLLNARPSTIEVQDESGFTGLHVAAQKGNEEMAKLLLNRGADIEARSVLARTALHEAATYGHITVLTLLLGAGADAEARDYTGDSALDLATRCAKYPIVELLTKRAAETKMAD